jgi:hypothetical protein
MLAHPVNRPRTVATKARDALVVFAGGNGAPAFAASVFLARTPPFFSTDSPQLAVFNGAHQLAPI